MTERMFLLTGAAGYLGSNVSRLLIERGERVRALVLPGDPAAGQVPEQAEVVRGDLLDPDALDRFFTMAEDVELVVLHCASMVTVSPEFSQKLLEVNVEGTRNIVNRCVEYGARKLVYVSSTGAIPERPRGEAIREVASLAPEGVVGWYGKTKAMATQLVLDAVRERGLDASIVYPSGIFGPNDYACGYVSRFVMDAAGGKLPAGIAGSFNVVDVRDLAAGVVACAERGRKGEGYIMANELATVGDVLRITSELTGAKEVKTVLPIAVARVLAFFAGLHSRLTGRPAFLTSFALYNLARNNEFCSDKAQRELGFQTRPFRETMADTVAWLAREGKITLRVSVDSEERCLAGSGSRVL